MPIIRKQVQFEKRNFTRIPNDWLRDERLSLKAKGLLAQLMSHSPGWRLTVQSLADTNGCGTHAISKAIEELETSGYLVREQRRDDLGRLQDVDWFTNDPMSNYPVPDSPASDNRPHKKTKEKKTKEKKPNTPRATTIPDDFEITDDMRSWASDTVPGLDIDWHTQSFIDFWHSASRNNTKKNWVATWRNWMRKEYERSKPRNANRSLSNAQKNLLELQKRMEGAQRGQITDQ